MTGHRAQVNPTSRKRREGQDVGRLVDEQRRRITEPLGELLDDPGGLGEDLVAVGLFEERAHERADHGLSGRRDPREQVADEVDTKRCQDAPGRV